MNNAYAEMELSLHRRDESGYAVEFRFTQAGDDADNRLGTEQVKVILDVDKLRELTYDPKGYGQALTSAMFADPALLTAYAQARTSAQKDGAPLRLRLFIGPSAPELHAIRWELLNEPQTGSPIATDHTIFFSRYLSSQDWRPVRLRSRQELKALAVIAAPQGLEEYNLAPVDKAAEAATITTSLADIKLRILEQATINEIVSALTVEEYDILYLVAHGIFARGEGHLWLEDESGKIARITSTELVTRLRELERRPRMVILVSCQSAGRGTGEVLTALGPRLAEAGIPAVLAMQDNLYMDTVARFMPAFLAELQKDGQIDRAISVARGLIRSQADWWVPALFMRLKSGRLWYLPGVGLDGKEFGKFPAVLRNIRKARTTPIIGPGLIEPLFGSLREVARRWAEEFQYPMAPHERESLPQVAQFLSISQDPLFPFDELEEYLRTYIRNRHKDDLPPELLGGSPPLDKLIEAVGARHRADNPLEPHRILAGLDLPIYVTANPDSLLEAALREAGKEPQSVLCPWNEEIDPPQVSTPDPAHPLVYHFFGRWSQPESMVLTEDQYFAFLIGATRNTDIIPERVREALTNAGLLFLGFQTDEWAFRVLFQTILAQPGSGLRSNYAQVAAQVVPEDERLLAPQRALKYLEKYFAKGADIEIYWGNPQEFLGELTRQAQNR
jgi:hypothetical protein